MPFDQIENLRTAIVKKKARIAQIERTLNRSLPIRGVNSSSLVRLEEERQRLLLSVRELESEMERRQHPPHALSSADLPIIESRTKYGVFPELTDEDSEEIQARLTGKRTLPRQTRKTRRYRTQQQKNRTAAIKAAIKSNLKGARYAQELHANGIKPRPEWIAGFP